MIDLRSDTVTKPSKLMKDAMFSAKVGDDVFAEDPTVNRLQEKLADMFSQEAALYCPSGTMTNQIAINVHTNPGDEVICHAMSHVYNYEGGGIARNSGASVRLVQGKNGIIESDSVRESINPNDSHYSRSTLVCLEDTVNKGGGCYYNLAQIKDVRKVCNENQLSLHLDGARLFNALTETGYSTKDYGALYDSISICLSKGLGAPLGSVLLGSKSFIQEAHRARKVFGGGMRQAGLTAAAGLYALEHNVPNLKEDHRRAKAIGEALEQCNWVKEILPVLTNIVIFELAPSHTPTQVVEKLASKGIACFPFGPTKIRFVTHLDFTDQQLDQCVAIIKDLY